ncbi:MAG: ATP-binding protein, partial [Planctomycetota bacterium]
PVELILHIAPDVPRRVMADPKRLRQIVVNLAGNAIKFTNAGYVTVKVRTTAAPPYPEQNPSLDQHDLQIIVCDSGIGIAEDQQQQIFEAFQQAHAGTTRRFGGTGLGLSICRELLNRMNGTIRVESTPGSGSTFICDLSLSPAPPRKQDARDQHSISVLQESMVNIVAKDDRQSEAVSDMLRAGGVTSVNSQRLKRLDAWPEQETSKDSADDTLPQRSVDVHLLDVGSVASSIDRPPGSPGVIWINRLGKPQHAATNSDDVILVKPVGRDELIDAILNLRSDSQDADQSVLPEHRDYQDRQAGSLGQLPPLNLLVVDDSAVNRIVIRDLVARRGHRVITASGGSDAIALIGESIRSDTDELRPFDVVLMDLQMPMIDGVEATLRIQETCGEEAPPIIALSAHVTDEHRLRCMDAGMVDFVTKPVREPLLYHALKKVLHNREGIQDDQSVDAIEEDTNDIIGNDAATRAVNTTTLPIHSTIALLKWAGDDRENAIELGRAFLIEGPQLLRQIQQAIADEDPKRLRQAAHTLKSCLRYVAAGPHSVPAADIEGIANAAIDDEAAAQRLATDTTELLAELKRIVSECQRHVSEAIEDLQMR